MLLPFVQIGGNWYVIVNWTPGMKVGQYLHLRPLDQQETEWLEPRLEDAVMGVWATLFPNDEAIREGAEPPEDEG